MPFMIGPDRILCDKSAKESCLLCKCMLNYLSVDMFRVKEWGDPLFCLPKGGYHWIKGKNAAIQLKPFIIL